MRLRRVAIDMKKQVRGRTVRTATMSLAGQVDTDGTPPAGRDAADSPNVLSPGRRYPANMPRR
jgi:hypothetical protein